MSSITLGPLSDLPDNSMRGYVHGPQQIAVYHVAGQLYATDNICSHEEALLTEGWLEPDDCTVECPLHGARFALQTGAVLSLPAVKPIAVYPVTIQNGQICVDLPAG